MTTDRTSDRPVEAPLDLHLSRDAQGRLVYTDAEGRRHEGVGVVRPFPLSAPDDAGLAIVDAHGHELLWIAPGRRLAPAAARCVGEELAARDFRPRIARLVDVSTFSTPSRWTVETDRGPTRFVLKGEEQIRRLEGGRLLITSEDGVTFEITDRHALDRGSRRLLERFL